MTKLSERVRDRNGRSDEVLLRDETGDFGLADFQAPTADGDDWNTQTVAVCHASPKALLSTLLALDGAVRALVLLAPSLSAASIETLMARTGANLLISDRNDLDGALNALRIRSAPVLQPLRGPDTTIWLMTSSGTMGLPKTVPHSLGSLTRSVLAPLSVATAPVWGLLYEPSRFAGMQVVLQALLGGGVLLAPDAGSGLGAQLRFLDEHGCTHLSATPTMWRKILMMPDSEGLAPVQITLGGEIADDAILRSLAARFPTARLTHIYASTELGVGFSVNDGRAGFPLAYLAAPHWGMSLKVNDGFLWVRPAQGVTEAVRDLCDVDDEGFANSRDRVEIRGDRVVFLGRDDASVNVGGIKVHPEMVEAHVNAHPGVAASAVEVRPSALVGALLTLNVVPHDPETDPVLFRRDIKAWCRGGLPREAQPATIRVVGAVAASAGGKLLRTAAS